MKLTVIGHWGGYPKVNEASSGYLLEHEGFKLLIDCGSGVLSQVQNYLQPQEINAVILSHYHPDHVADIGVLQHALLIQGILGKSTGNVPIYAHDQDTLGFKQLTYKQVTTGIAYDPNKALFVGPFTISFLRTVHPVECYAMRIEVDGKVLVYTADTAYKDEFISFSSNADILLCESNFYENQNGSGAGHMTSAQAGMLANKANCKQLVLTHLPHFGNIEQLRVEAQQYFPRTIYLANKGLMLEV